MSDNLRGAALMTASMAAFTINDMFVKLLGDHLPFFQFLLLRTIGAAFFLFLLARRAGAIRWPSVPRDRRLIVIRSLAEVAAAYFFLNALINMPIANATAIIQALPLTVSLGAALFLGENVGWRRFTAIGLGFLGVFLIVRPGSDGFTIYSIYALLAVVAVTAIITAIAITTTAAPTTEAQPMTVGAVIATTTITTIAAVDIAPAWSTALTTSTGLFWGGRRTAAV